MGPVTLQRDELSWAREHGARLSAAGVVDGGAALTHIARQRATVMRKFIIENTRLARATGGYVITGWRDTPIATSGVVDDFGRPKFAPEEWRKFNADRVLVIDRERRRVWVNGGDRPVRRDPRSWWADEPIEIHFALSNGGSRISGAVLRWRLLRSTGGVVDSGETGPLWVAAGSVSELAVVSVENRLEPVGMIEGLVLQAELECGGEVLANNEWLLWLVPRVDITTLLDRPELAECLDSAVIARARDGLRFLVWHRDADHRFLGNAPFWREAVHVLGPPISNAYANLGGYGLATDLVIDPHRLATSLDIDPASITSLWCRFDARAMTRSDYVVDIPFDQGLVRLSTLRFAGGLGDQPASLATNPMGAWLLAHLLDTLGGASGASGAT
jgi:hypothetical protein